MSVALIGLVRATAEPGETARQRAALEPICFEVCDEPASRRMLIENRPPLMDAIARLNDGDELTVERLTALGPGRVGSYVVLARLFDLGVPVRILNGYASRAPLDELVDYGRALDNSRAAARRAAIHCGQHADRTAELDKRETCRDSARKTVSERVPAGDRCRRRCVPRHCGEPAENEAVALQSAEAWMIQRTTG